MSKVDFYRFSFGWIVQWSHWTGSGQSKSAAILNLKKAVFATGRAPRKYWKRRPQKLRDKENADG